MKKAIIILVCIISSLKADFKSDFLIEVISITEMGTSDITEAKKDLIDKFHETSKQEASDTDANIRPLYVGVQGDFEKAMAHLLKEGKIHNLVGWIHTPTPATPLCTEGEISEGLVDQELGHDPKSLITVKTRPAIIRDYLRTGGILFALYPKSGLGLCSDKQLEIFNKVKAEFPAYLIDTPLAYDELPQDMIGATYTFEDAQGSPYGFAIQATQANAPENFRKWALWFGPLSDKEVKARIDKVSSLILNSARDSL